MVHTVCKPNQAGPVITCQCRSRQCQQVDKINMEQVVKQWYTSVNRNDFGKPVVVKADGLAAGKGVIVCDHVTQALQTMRSVRGVRSATVFGQSMHLLVDDAITRTDIEKKLREVGIQSAEIHVIGPSLEDVFVALTAKYGNGQKEERAA